MMTEHSLNDHNKQEYPPAHTCEHILNGTMVKMFGCPRSKNAHIEKKKCKCDYILESCPDADAVTEIEKNVNGIILAGMEVKEEFVTREEAAGMADLSKLPEDVSETIRIIRIGDYDTCACIGAHVSNTSEIGRFTITSHSYENGIWRVRWKLL